jgi:hypothetical protein
MQGAEAPSAASDLHRPCKTAVAHSAQLLGTWQLAQPRHDLPSVIDCIVFVVRSVRELRRCEGESESRRPVLRATVIGHGATQVGPAGAVELPSGRERGPACGEGAQLSLQLRVGPP